MPNINAGLFSFMEYIISLLLKGYIQGVMVSKQQSGTKHGRAQHLMRVPCKGIGLLYPTHQVTIFIRNQNRPTMSAIDMKPDAVCITEVAYLLEAI